MLHAGLTKDWEVCLELTCDRRGRILDVSRDAFGLTARLPTQTWLALFSEQWQERARLYLEGLASGESSEDVLLFSGSGERDRLLLVAGVSGNEISIVAGRSAEHLHGYCEGLLTHLGRVEAELTHSKNELAEVRSYFQELLRDRDQSAALEEEVTRAFTRHRDVDELLSSCVQAIVHFLGAVTARVWMLEDGDLLQLRASAGLSTHSAGWHSFARADHENLARILLEKRYLVRDDFAEDVELLDLAWGKREGLAGFLGCPLVVDKKLVGVVVLFTSGPLPPVCVTGLEMVARTCGQAWARRSLAMQLASSALQRAALSALLVSEAKFKDIFEHMEDGYLEAVSGETVTVVNPAAAHLLGYAGPEELECVSPLNLLADPEQLAEFQHALQTSGEVRSSCIQLCLKDGRVGSFEGNFRQIATEKGPRERLVLTFRDITDRLRAEEELRGRLTAEAASRLKGQFLANMSHEIRTPMHGVLGLTHLVLQTKLTPIQSDYLLKIQQSGRALLHIVDDILDFSKVEAGKVELEHLDFNLKDVLARVVHTTGEMAAAKGLETLLSVASGVPSRLKGDPVRLGQILINLVGNAIKFTETGEVRILVDLQSIPAEKVYLRFQVRDTGMGIDPQTQSQLFKAFTQGDISVTRKFGGTGLGLAICKRLVELMQGEIRVQSVPGEGSTFSFTAHFGSVASTGAGTPSPLTGLRALVLDFNDLTRRVIVDSLTLFDIVVTEETSVHGALSRLGTDAKAFDLILVDHKMAAPLDNLDMIRSIRQLCDSETLVVLVTRDAATGLVERAMEMGALGVLFTPFTQSHLLELLLTLRMGTGSGVESRAVPLAAVARATYSALCGARVLVAEDHPINQQIVRELLQWVGIDAEVVGNGAEAIAQFSADFDPEDCPWDLILMDLQMPIMDGYSASARLRSDPRLDKLPILAMTAHVLAEEKERCFAAGMNDFVSKPIDPEVLFATLTRWLAPDHQVTEAKALPAAPDDSTRGVLNTHLGLSRVAGNSALYESLLKEFAAHQQDTASELVAACEAQDLPLVGQLCHRLQGVAGNLGMDQLCQRLLAMSTLVKLGGTPALGLPGILAELETVCRQIRLSDEHPKSLPPDSEVLSLDAQDDALNIFAEQLRLVDGCAPDAIPGIRHLLLKRGHPDADVERLSCLVSQYRYEDARLLLQDLMTQSTEVSAP